jgi:hypothetical protein
MRRLLILPCCLVALVGLVACSSSGDGDGDDETSSSDDSAAETTTTTAFEVAAADQALCDLLAAAHDDSQALSGVNPTGVPAADLGAMAAAAPPELAPLLQSFAADTATYEAAVAQVQAGGDPRLMGDAIGPLSSPDAEVAWGQVLTFAVERCELESSGLALVQEAAAGSDSEAADDARAALEASDPGLAAAAEDLTVTEEDGEVIDVSVVIASSAGQDGALRMCEVLSTFLYDDLGAPRAGINIESADGVFYASRFNETADCQ